MSNVDDIFQNQLLELRRGSIVLAIVGVLHKKQQYGYSLLETLRQHDFNVEGNTLYPLLRRLQTQGVLTSNWDTSDSRPRKYYSLTPDGEELYKKLTVEWTTMNTKIHKIITEKL